MNGHRLRNDVLSFWRGRPTWAIPLLLFLAVVLVAALAFNLANLDTGGEALPTAPDGGEVSRSPLLTIEGWIVDVLLIVVAGAFLVGVLYAMIFLRASLRRSKRRGSWQALLPMLGVLLLLALLLAWPRVERLGGAANETTDPATSEGGGEIVNGWRAAAGPSALFLMMVVLAAVLAIAYLLRRAADPFRSVRTGPTKAPDPMREATEALRAAIIELEIGGDVRTAILACFQRFCLLLGRRGITEQDSLTPRELEGLAVGRLRVSTDASSTLTGLFEEARYSEHSLGEPDRERAIESLSRIRAALEA